MRSVDEFGQYRARPGEDTLLALLRGSQDMIYRLSSQILGQAQDAEDAAQKVLLRLLDLLPRVTGPEHWRSLVARVSLQVSLNVLEERRTRLRHEMSKARTDSESRQGSDAASEAACALHRAIGLLG